MSLYNIQNCFIIIFQSVLATTSDLSINLQPTKSVFILSRLQTTYPQTS